MKDIDELRQHPQFANLIKDIQKRVDNSALAVITAATSKPIEEARFMAGGHVALKTVLADLTGQEDQ